MKRNSLNVFFRNVKFLFRDDLKSLSKSKLDESKFYDIIEGLQFQPNIAQADETINFLIYTNKSFCRMGDGEFLLMEGKSLPFQNYNEELSDRLKEILISNIETIMVGIPYPYFHYDNNYLDEMKGFNNSWILANRKKMIQLLDLSKQYYDSACALMHLVYKSMNFDEYFDRMQNVWRGKDITIVCGHTVFDNIKINIFDSASTVEYIYAPSKNAFDTYNSLLAETLGTDKKRLIIIILGPTATVLAYDLAQNGFRALDLGHIAKDYSYFKTKVDRTPETITDFYSPD